MAELSTANKIREQLSNCRNLPTIPGVAVELLACLKETEVDLRELSMIIRRDPALSAKILGFLNSAHFGLRKEITSIQHAATMLGLQAIQTIALSFALVRGMRSSDLAGFDYNRFWKRSILSAAAAAVLGQSRQIAKEEELFLAGLLQDIGMLALQAILPTEYGELNREAGKDHTMLCALERDRFGADHAIVGSWLAELWQLPEIFRLGIRASHELEEVEMNEEVRGTLEVVSLSGWLAEIWLDRSHSLVYLRGRSWTKLVKGMRKGEIRQIASQMSAWLNDLSHLFKIQVEDCTQAVAIMLEARDRLVGLNLETLQQTEEENVERARLLSQNNDLKEKCFRDAITGLHNRAYFETFLADQFVTDSARGKSTSVVFCDVDNFKLINDAHGHQTGDSCLALLANIIKKNTRENDHVMRWGGDEFVVVLPDTDRQSAVRIAERFREEISHTSHTTDNGAIISTTLSTGCATHDKQTLFPCLESLVSEADVDLLKNRIPLKKSVSKTRAG